MKFIGGSWAPASISALAAIFGSLTGALASSVTTWITQKHQADGISFLHRAISVSRRWA
jgi:hypothetical protein